MNAGKIFQFILILSIVGVIFSQSTTKALAQACINITAAPNLYEVKRNSSQATLYFTPVNEGVTKYTVEYGNSSGAGQHSITFNHGTSTGAVSYVVNDLETTIKYYFRVRAGNDCSNGQWSSWLGDSMVPTPTGKVKSAGMPVAGADDARNIAIISLAMAASGFFLFSLSRKN